MKFEVTDLKNKKIEDIELSEDVFSAEVKQDLLHKVVNWQLAKRRTGAQSVLSRSEVKGTTKKPFRQKGTGNARQGSLKGPHQRGGGVAHAFKPRDYGYKLNKKLRKAALKSAISLKVQEGKLKIVDTLVSDDPKTSSLKKTISEAGISSALFVRGDNQKDGFYKASRNLHKIDQIPEYGLNVYDILNHDNLVFTKHAAQQLEKRLAS